MQLQLSLILNVFLIVFNLQSADTVWTTIPGQTSMTKTRLFGNILGNVEITSPSNCRFRQFDRLARQIGNPITLVPPPTNCRDFEFFTDPLTSAVYLYTLENGILRVRKQTADGFFEQLATADIRVPSLSVWRLGLYAEVYHKLLIVTGQVNIVFVDLKDLENPQELSRLTIPAGGGGGPYMAAFVGNNLHIILSLYSSNTIDLRTGILRDMTPIPGLAANKNRLRSVFNLNGNAIYTTENSDTVDVVVNNATTKKNIKPPNVFQIINGQTLAAQQLFDTSPITNDISTGHVIGASAFNSVIAMGFRNTYSRVVFLAADTFGNLSFVGQSERAASVDINDMWWSNDDILLGGFSLFSYDSFSSMMSGYPEMKQYTLGAQPSYGIFLNPLSMVVSADSFAFEGTNIKGEFTVQVWDKVLNYTFIPIKVTITHNMESPWNLYIQDRETSVAGDLIESLKPQDYDASALVSKVFRIQTSETPEFTGSYQITIQASDGRAGVLTKVISVDFSGKTPPIRISSSSSSSSSRTSSSSRSTSSSAGPTSTAPASSSSKSFSSNTIYLISAITGAIVGIGVASVLTVVYFRRRRGGFNYKKDNAFGSINTSMDNLREDPDPGQVFNQTLKSQYTNPPSGFATYETETQPTVSAFPHQRGNSTMERSHGRYINQPTRYEEPTNAYDYNPRDSTNRESKSIELQAVKSSAQHNRGTILYDETTDTAKTVLASDYTGREKIESKQRSKESTSDTQAKNTASIKQIKETAQQANDKSFDKRQAKQTNKDTKDSTDKIPEDPWDDHTKIVKGYTLPKGAFKYA